MTTTIEVHQDKQKIYDILFDEEMECFAEHFQTLGFQNRKLCIVTDSNIEPHHAETSVLFLNRSQSMSVCLRCRQGKTTKPWRRCALSINFD